MELNKCKLKIEGIFLSLLLFIGTSCENFVEVDLPTSQVGSASIFMSDGTARSAVASIYGSMSVSAPSFASGGRGSITFLNGLSADELIPFSITGETFYLNNVLPTDPTVSSLWNKFYNIIYSANAVIEGLDKSENITPALKNQLKGEALFLRALCHFYLLNLWGDVPIITSTDYRMNSLATRSSTAQVYNSITADLIEASDLMAETYPSTGRVRANKWVAKTLLARVYLYLGDWSNAEALSASLIENSVMYKLTDLNNVFLKNSDEVIWQILPVTGLNNSFDAETFIATTTPKWASLNKNLLKEFQIGDKRKASWVGKVIVVSDTIYFPYKYKKMPSDPSTEYSVIFRLAEQYLIRAEARAKLNKISEAIADVDVIRTRAGLPLISQTNPSIGQEELLLAIEKERRFELFAEWGHRWFDLKRTGRSQLVLKNKLGWAPTDVLLPIPQTEILRSNERLSQNPGYN